MEEKKFTHFNAAGRPRMVDVSEKEPTVREAVARGEVVMSSATLAAVKEGRVKKGDVLAVAQVAGIMAAKRTATIIPMCHPIGLTGVDLHFTLQEPDRILIQATVRTCDRTGVEMEALTAVAAAALTIYDMCKSIDKGMVINNIRLIKKTGGKSGDYYRPGEEEENEG